MAEDETASKGTQNEAEENPKEIAKLMFIDGYDRPNIVDEIAEATGLGKRTIWAIKGALARSRQIPTKEEMEKITRKKPGPAERDFIGEGEEDRIPFRRPSPPHVLIERTLKKFGVKDRTRDIIVDRCRTAGGMHPADLQRALSELDTGLTRRSEVNFIVEDYYLALQAEQEKAQEYEQGWPMRSRGEPSRGRSYGAGYGMGYPQREEYGRGYDYGRGIERRPWERSYGRGGGEPLDERTLMDILERRDSRLMSQFREKTIEDKLVGIGEDIGVLATELRNLKENPPTTPQPSGPSDFEKSLQHTIERQDKKHDELMGIIRDERAESKADAKDLREIYDKRLDKQEKDFKEELGRRGRPYDSAGYTEDSFRLAGEGLHEVADVLRTRGSPFRIIIEGLDKITGGREGGRPPQRERGAPSSVADLVGDDYVEK